MKTQHPHAHRLRRFGLAAFTAAVFAVPALAQTADFGPLPPRPVVVESETVAPPAAPVVPAPLVVATESGIQAAPLVVATESGIHAGANNPADNELAARVAGAIADEPRLDGATVTVSANDGRVSLSGSADSPEQAAIAEQVARGVAGPGAVSGTLSSTGG